METATRYPARYPMWSTFRATFSTNCRRHSYRTKNARYTPICVLIWTNSQVHAIFKYLYYWPTQEKWSINFECNFFSEVFEPKWARYAILAYRHIISNLAGLKLSISTSWRPTIFEKHKEWPSKLVLPLLPEPVSPSWVLYLRTHQT